MRRVALFFGSFNPVHNGHTEVARWAAERFGETWLVVSPQNPFRNDLAAEEDRLAMTRIAVAERLAGLPVSVSDIEFRLPRPSYTIDTLRVISSEYPDVEFSLLVGADVREQIPQWKDGATIIEKYIIRTYPRGLDVSGDLPLLDFSSTDVRRTLREGGDVSGMVCPGVAEYIEKHGLWQPVGADAWLNKGRRLQQQGRMGEALSVLLKARELDPVNTETEERIKMLREIFSFHYVDYYNP